MASKNEWDKFSITLTKELEKTISPEELAPAFKKACLRIEADVKKMCPADTGALRNSISTEFTITKNALKAEIGTPLFYAPYVEWGTGLFAKGEGGSKAKKIPWTYYSEKTGQFYTTSGQPPKPYLLPALNKNKGNIENALEAEIKRILKEV